MKKPVLIGVIILSLAVIIATPRADASVIYSREPSDSIINIGTATSTSIQFNINADSFSDYVYPAPICASNQYWRFVTAYPNGSQKDIEGWFASSSLSISPFLADFTPFSLPYNIYIETADDIDGTNLCGQGLIDIDTNDSFTIAQTLPTPQITSRCHTDTESSASSTTECYNELEQYSEYFIEFIIVAITITGIIYAKNNI